MARQVMCSSEAARFKLLLLSQSWFQADQLPCAVVQAPPTLASLQLSLTNLNNVSLLCADCTMRQLLLFAVISLCLTAGQAFSIDVGAGEM
jgi:hypothetical protein